jgi:hypothetical protein
MPDSAGIAARVRAIDDAFFLEEFSSKALNFPAKKRGLCPVQPITWTARRSEISSSGTTSSDSAHSGSDVDFQASTAGLAPAGRSAGADVRNFARVTPPGSPILTVSADELSEDTISPSRSTISVERTPSIVLGDAASANPEQDSRVASCLPGHKKSAFGGRRSGVAQAGSLEAYTLDRSAGTRTTSTGESVHKNAADETSGGGGGGGGGGGIPRRFSKSIRRVLGRRDPSYVHADCNIWDTTSMVEDIHSDPYVDAGVGCLSGILRDPASGSAWKYHHPHGQKRDQPDLWFSENPGAETDTVLSVESVTFSGSSKIAPEESPSLGPEIHRDAVVPSPVLSQVSISTVFNGRTAAHRNDRPVDTNERFSDPRGRYPPPVYIAPRADSDSPRLRIAERASRYPASRASSMVQDTTVPRRVSRMGLGYRRRDVKAASGRFGDDYMSFTATSPPVREKRRSWRWF